MSPSELQAKINFLAANPPNIKPFSDAAQRAAVKAQSDLNRLNSASNVSITVQSSSNTVRVAWTVNRSGTGSSRISPSAAIKTHLNYEMKQAKASFQADLTKKLSS